METDKAGDCPAYMTGCVIPKPGFAEPLAEPKLEELPDLDDPFSSRYKNPLEQREYQLRTALAEASVLRGERDRLKDQAELDRNFGEHCLKQAVDTKILLREYKARLEAAEAQLAGREWVEIKEGSKLPDSETLCLIVTNEPTMQLARMGGYQDIFWEEGHSGSIPASCVHKYQIVALDSPPTTPKEPQK